MVPTFLVKGVLLSWILLVLGILVSLPFFGGLTNRGQPHWGVYSLFVCFFCFCFFFVGVALIDSLCLIYVLSLGIT